MLTEPMIAELRELEKKGGGELHTDAVVALARKPSSALHDHPAFIWDIKKAAMQQWSDAARAVIQCFVGIIRDNGEAKEMRHFVSVRTIDGAPIYRSTQKVLIADRSLLVKIIADRILAQIRHYPLSEFDPVIALVEEIKSVGKEEVPV